MSDAAIPPPQPNQPGSLRHLFDLPQEVIEMLPVAAYACDGSGRILWFNRRAADIWGRAPARNDGAERFSGALKIYVDGRQVAHDETPMAHVLKTGEAVPGAEIVIERADGTKRWAVVHIAPVKDEAGRVLGAINCFHDRTELHQISCELVEKQQELEDFFENGAVPLHMVSGEGIILRANKAELDLLGYQRDEYVGRNIAEFHADSDVLSDILARLAKGEKLDRYPARLRAKDGTLRHVHVTSSARFHEGQFASTRCFTIDVTDEMTARQRAAETEERFQHLLQALPAAIYMTDAEGRITYYNQAAVDMSGRRPELGSDQWCVSWRMYNPDGTPLPHDQCPMAVALKERRPVRDVDIVAERPDGTRLPVMPFPTPLHDESGRFVGAVNMLVDITELKRAEELASRRMNEQAALYRFTDRLYRATDLAEVYEAAIDAILSALRCDRASILRFDEKGVMRFVAWRGLSESYRRAVDGHSPWKVGDIDPSPISLDDIDASGESDALKAVVKAEGLRGLAFIPIVANGSVVGKFMAYYERPHSFDEHELDLAVTIARQLGFSIEKEQVTSQRTLLIHELNHRVKNTLSTLQSLATQTLRHTTRSADARDLFESRLMALSRAHDVLTIRSWGPANLRDIVLRGLEPFQMPGDRITVDGPDVDLSPKQALALSMALHELATNAAKYGALSNDAGRVHVTWVHAPLEIAGGVRLTWKEEHGPPVVPSTRKGFGSRLIERNLGNELGGTVDIYYLPAGLVCTIEWPIGPVAIAEAGGSFAAEVAK